MLNCRLAVLRHLHFVGRLAYISKDPKFHVPASDMIQLLALELISRADRTLFNPAITVRLAAYIARGSLPQTIHQFRGGYYSETLAHIIRVFNFYDMSRNPTLFMGLPEEVASGNSDREPIEISISGSIKPLEENGYKSVEAFWIKFHEDSLEPVSIKISLEEQLKDSNTSLITTPRWNIEYRTHGEGEVWATLAGNFILPLNQSYPVYNGILLEKSYQLSNLEMNRCSGLPLLHAKPGDVLCITIGLTVKDYLEYENRGISTK